MITEKKMSLSELFESFPSINLSLKEIREIIPAEEVMSRKFVFIDSDLLFDIEEEFGRSLEKESRKNERRELPPPPEVHYFSSFGIHRIMEEMNDLCGMDEIGRSDLEVLGFDYGEGGENCHIYEILDEEKFLKGNERFNFNYKNVVLTKTDKYDSI